jgi:elongation factor G
VIDIPEDMVDDVATFSEQLVEAVASYDDELMEKFF